MYCVNVSGLCALSNTLMLRVLILQYLVVLDHSYIIVILQLILNNLKCYFISCITSVYIQNIYIYIYIYIYINIYILTGHFIRYTCSIAW